ncbi:carboxypeptidase-like regulatory domain-containing protein [Zhouia sp. PK063]|uniref:carboxypeptidase-like regulatory domain-containing protein n=1 Tax=Zhouia sp. PK063 TaxID=3373602 RepID=UPI0037A6EF09
MKHLLMLIFYLISISSFSQNWTLNNVDKHKKYGFQYIFSFQNNDDSNSYKIITKEHFKITAVTGQVFDHANIPIAGAHIKITSKKGSFSKEIYTNFNGNFEIALSSGEYLIEINSIGFDNFKTDFSIKANTITEFKINLGLGEELRIYQIDSKRELTKNEIMEIMECVNNKRKSQDFNTTACSQKNLYTVTIQQ